MDLKHFGHEHSLSLFNEESKNGKNSYWCWDCNNDKPIQGPRFSCASCNFHMHKLCAEMPPDLIHFWHPQHHLACVTVATKDYVCNACKQAGSRIFYHCSHCNFSLGFECAILPQTIERSKGHQHPLTLQLKQASFCCDACGITHKKGFSYQCAACHFWVHEDCASLLPDTIKHISHGHPLTLTSPSHLENDFKFHINCDICLEEIDKRAFVYWCTECKYFAHVRCGTSMGSTDMYDDTEIAGDSTEPDLFCLPMPNECRNVDMVSRQIEKISMEYSSSCDDDHHHQQPSMPDEIERVRREHEWVRREHKNLNKCDHPRLTLIGAQTDDEICDACVQPISSPHYHCPECHLMLHESCAKLPREIHHPLHYEHRLTLICNLAGFSCHACRYFCNGFAFYCGPCKIYFDIKCVSLPTIIKHETHQHLLHLEQDTTGPPSRCNACFQHFGSCHKFGCSTCKFSLHIQCALLPKTLEHRYDEHALTLTYSAARINSEEHCEICEEQLNPKIWFYHCADCNYSFHSKCICKFVAKYANVKLGISVNVLKHPHLLTLAQRETQNPPFCNRCRKPCDKVAYECSDECQFNLHFDCMLKS